MLVTIVFVLWYASRVRRRNLSVGFTSDTGADAAVDANFDRFDDAGNQLNVTEFEDNQYCEVTCKEDWQITMDSFGNYAGDKAVAAGNKELAEKSLRLAIKSLDNAKSKGLVHRNKVDREKSRLTLKVNKMESK